MTVRGTITRDLVVRAAADVADRGGIASVSMRTVAAELGLKAMSLYHHVSNKEDLLDALAGWVFDQIELPSADAPWRSAMEQRARSARAVLRRHVWAVGMLESRPTPSAALLRHHDRVLGWLFGAGLSASLATHAFSTVDAFVYGFVLSESSLPFADQEGAEADFAAGVAPDPVVYPHLARSMDDLFGNGNFAYADEFDAGLELILDAVDSRRKASL